MAHLDSELLVLIALGESTDRDHLDTCDTCRAEVDALRSVAAVAAETQDVRDLPTPPATVWASIAAATGAEASTTARRPLSTASTRPPRPGPDPAPPRRAGRHRRWGVRVAALAAAAAVGIAGTLAANRLLRNDPPTPLACGPVVARADLSGLPLAPAGATGQARVLCDGPQRRLHLHVTGLPLQPGYYEVWLIDPNTMEMTAIGQLGDGNDVLLPLSSTTDLRKYRLVDISAEQYDNDQAHSGKSMLRGQLTT